MPWHQLEVASRHPDFAEELLLAGGAITVSQLDAGDDPVLEPPPGTAPLWPCTQTIGLFSEDVPLDVVIENLRETLPDGESAVIRRTRLDDREWTRAWMRDWHPMSFGSRLWICPSGRSVDAPGAVVVDLDPGLAFGTGTHQSTALCLRWLDGADLAGRTVLDYGCGSGVLAIAALKLGARRALAVDIDPQARSATRENATRNGLEGQLEICPVDAPLEPSEVVLANILAGPLVDLAPRLTAGTCPGGHLVLAGVLAHQAESVCAAYREHFELDAPVLQDDWARVHGIRR